MDNFLSWAPWIFIAATVVTLVTLVVLNVLEHRSSKAGGSRLTLTIKIVTIAATVLNLALGVALKLSNVSLTREAPGATSIRTFYKHIDNKTPEQIALAWEAIHSARKVEIERWISTPEEFGARYATTRRHANLDVVADRRESEDEELYWVSFDVVDMVDFSSVHSYLWLPVQRAVDDGIVSAEAVEKIVVADLRRAYDFPDDRLPEIRRYILETRLKFLSSPKLITEIATAIGAERRKAVVPSGLSEVWTHYLLHVKVQRDAREWKIRSGLHPVVFEGYYDPNTEKPSQ